jgi:hypothetical protein
MSRRNYVLIWKIGSAPETNRRPYLGPKNKISGAHTDAHVACPITTSTPRWSRRRVSIASAARRTARRSRDLTAYPFNNALLLRLSDIGEAYDPHTGQGVGDSAYPQATGHDPTCTIGALA